MKLKVILPVLFIFNIVVTYAQNEQEKADAYFVEAESEYNNGKYLKTLSLLEKSENTLGETNARILNLKVKTFYAIGNYEDAKLAISKFDKYVSSEELRKATYSYLTKIENYYKKKEEETKEDDDLWNKVEAKNTAYSYMNYISKYPYGKHISTARKRFNEISKKDYDDAIKSNTIEEYEAFLTKWGSGSRHDDIKKRLKLKKEKQRKKINASKRMFIDERDNKIYYTIKIGDQVWMAENLAFVSTLFSLNKSAKENIWKYGYLYKYEKSFFKKACPENWHIPTKEEWEKLAEYLGGNEIAAKKIKNSTEWGNSGTGESVGFDALPTGYKDSNNQDYIKQGEEAYFWTSTKSKAKGKIKKLYTVRLDKNTDKLEFVEEPSVNYYSIRCIKSNSNNNINYQTDTSNVSLIVESMPEFPGGKDTLPKFISENMIYPEEAQRKYIQGKVYVQYTVSETGEVINVKVVKGIHPSLDKEAFRVISKLPKYKPGKNSDGKLVKVRYTVPINFGLN